MNFRCAKSCGLACLAISIAVGSFLVSPGQVDAQISYCGPVSYEYTRHLKWNMDHTDKQGHRHVQDKEEKKVMSSEFYVCLGGTMLGNTGIFDGEAMQQEVTFSATDTWLDQRTHRDSDGVAGRREDNTSSEEGQQSGMRGTLILDCPEGHKVPGKSCSYTLNLFVGMGYVYTSDQETFRPPETFTISVPQAFNRHLLLEDRPLKDTWSVEGEIRRDIKVEEHSDDCEGILGRPNIDSCSFEEWENVQWSFNRKGSPCDSRITRFKGDVTINGRPASEGTIHLAKGDVIQTGKQSQLRIQLGDGSMMKLGSGNRLEIDPCHLFSTKGRKGTRLRLWGGWMRAQVMKLVGAESNFEIRTGTGGGGIRGELPASEPNIMAFLTGLWPTARTAEAATLPEDFPTLGTRVASTVFSVETIPDEKVEVEVIKGSVMIRNATGDRRLLVTADQSVESWEDGSPFEDVIITNAPE